MGEGLEDLRLKAEAYISAGEHEKAFACYTLAARVSPEDPLPLLSAGLLHLSLGEAAEAKSLADEALARSPALADAWLLRLQADIDLADGEAVAQDLLYAEICGAVLSPAVYASLGALYSDSGDYERALDAFDLAVSSELTEAQRAAIQARKAPFDALNISILNRLIKPVELRRGITQAEVVDMFRLYQDLSTPNTKWSTPGQSTSRRMRQIVS